MKRLIFKKIDAFTKEKSTGNPAGCIYLGDEKLTEGEMLQIAQELKGFVNEVVYFQPIKKSSNNEEIIYSLKYYSSECEVEFCGHGTIACMYDVIKNDETLINREELIIRTSKGDLTVINKILSHDSVFITAPAPEFIGTDIPLESICDNLKIKEHEIDKDWNIDLINAGLNTLIVPIKTLDFCVTMLPDFMQLQQFSIDNNIDIITVFTTKTIYNNNEYRTRVFAPKFGYLEDPATGSGNAAIGYYLLKNKKWEGDSLSIEQGRSYDEPNIIKLISVKLKNGSRKILFGGRATVRIDGAYLLQ